MWVHNLNPTLLSIGSLEIRWYGLAYVFGALFSLWWLLYWQKNGFLKITKDEVWDFIFYCLLGTLIGARSFMLVWEPRVYLNNPIEIFYFWQGGMSFHGGFFGIIIAGLIFCKVKKIPFLQMADLMSFPTMIALALGRVANFFNGELVGTVFGGPWCVLFPGESECRHPSTIYAAIKRFAVAGWLYILIIKQMTLNFKTGFIFWNFMFFEGLGRFLVDFYREDVLYFGLSTGQWMSSVMIIIAGIILIKSYKNEFKKLFFSK